MWNSPCSFSCRTATHIVLTSPILLVNFSAILACVSGVMLSSLVVLIEQWKTLRSTSDCKSASTRNSRSSSLAFRPAIFPAIITPRGFCFLP